MPDLEAAASGGVADGQLGGAAVRLIVAAGGLGQRAAGPGEAVAEEVAQAAARRTCGVWQAGNSSLTDIIPTLTLPLNLT